MLHGGWGPRTQRAALAKRMQRATRAAARRRRHRPRAGRAHGIRAAVVAVRGRWRGAGRRAPVDGRGFIP